MASVDSAYESAQLRVASEKYRYIPEYQLREGIRAGTIQVSPSEVREYLNKAYGGESGISKSKTAVEVWNKSVEISNANSEVKEIKGQFLDPKTGVSYVKTTTVEELNQKELVPVYVESVTTKSGDVVPIKQEAEVKRVSTFTAEGKPLSEQVTYSMKGQVEFQATTQKEWTYQQTPVLVPQNQSIQIPVSQKQEQFNNLLIQGNLQTGFSALPKEQKFAGDVERTYIQYKSFPILGQIISISEKASNFISSKIDAFAPLEANAQREYRVQVSSEWKPVLTHQNEAYFFRGFLKGATADIVGLPSNAAKTIALVSVGKSDPGLAGAMVIEGFKSQNLYELGGRVAGSYVALDKMSKFVGEITSQSRTTEPIKVYVSDKGTYSFIGTKETENIFGKTQTQFFGSGVYKEVTTTMPKETFQVSAEYSIQSNQVLTKSISAAKAISTSEKGTLSVFGTTSSSAPIKEFVFTQTGAKSSSIGMTFVTKSFAGEQIGYSYSVSGPLRAIGIGAKDYAAYVFNPKPSPSIISVPEGAIETPMKLSSSQIQTIMQKVASSSASVQNIKSAPMYVKMVPQASIGGTLIKETSITKEITKQNPIPINPIKDTQRNNSVFDITQSNTMVFKQNQSGLNNLKFNLGGSSKEKLEYRQRTDNKIYTELGKVNSQIQTQKAAILQVPIGRTFTQIKPPKPPIIPPPNIPKEQINLGGFGRTQKFSSQKISIPKISRGFKYAPSLAAVAMGIKVKGIAPKGIINPFAIRPIFVKRGRKRK